MQADTLWKGDRHTAEISLSGSQPDLSCSVSERCIDAMPVQPQQETLSLWRESGAANIVSDICKEESVSSSIIK